MIDALDLLQAFVTGGMLPKREQQKAVCTPVASTDLLLKHLKKVLSLAPGGLYLGQT